MVVRCGFKQRKAATKDIKHNHGDFTACREEPTRSNSSMRYRKQFTHNAPHGRTLEPQLTAKSAWRKTCGWRRRRFLSVEGYGSHRFAKFVILHGVLAITQHKSVYNTTQHSVPWASSSVCLELCMAESARNHRSCPLPTP